MKISEFVSAIAGAISSVPFPKRRRAQQERKRTEYTLTVHSQKPIMEEEAWLLYNALNDYEIDPKVDSLALADQLFMTLKRSAVGGAPNRQIHLVFPLVSRNVKLTKRKPSYCLKLNERFLLANRSYNSYWVITIE